MKNNSRLVIFSGLDGSGKSTQINLLKTQIVSSNGNCKVFWARIGYTDRFEYLKSFIRKNIKNDIPPGKSEKRNRIFENKLFFFIWINLALFDLIILWGIIQRYYLFFNYTIICDRYIVDSEIDLKLNFPEFDYKRNILWRLLILLLPKKQQGFCLWIDPNLSLARSKLKDEPFPDDVKTLKSRLLLYKNHYFISTNKYHKIECNGSINEIFNEIKTTLDL